ncbi:MAG: type II secretion system F family protein [Pseudomonadota bacterium]
MFGFDETWFAPAASAAAALVSVLGFYYFVTTSVRENQMKKRMVSVADHRRRLRDAVSASSEARGRNAQQVALMSRAVAYFKLSDQLSDDALKMRLARAGLRSRPAAVGFLFARIALPPALIAATLLYFYLFLHAEHGTANNYLLAALGAGMLGYVAPGMWLDNAKTKRQQKLIMAYPDMLDLLTICVESGMSIEQSFARVAKEIGPNAPELSEELQLTTAELAFLGDRRRALDNLAERTDLAAVRAIVSALIQAEKYGTPVGQALRVASDESRNERMSRAEQKAAALPAKLTVPMMIFFLPILFIVILGPAVMRLQDAF